MATQWIVIAVLAVVALTFLKMEHHTRKIKVAIIVVFGLVLYFSLVNVLNTTEISIDSPRSIVRAIYAYFGWIGETGTELWDIGKDTVVLVGNAIKLNTTAG